jgi:uncharacterized membrane protein YfcA
MAVLITLSNAAGLSGAGSNIPIMLIFFGLSMNEAVPISAFVAVTATLFRFLLNFNQKHPKRPERLCINYEVVEITMPAVFFGSFLGVIISQQISQLTKEVMFGITVAWSIYTTWHKALQTLEKERLQHLESKGAVSEKSSLLNQQEEVEKEGGQSVELSPALQQIKHEEGRHFTGGRVAFILVCFLALFATQYLVANKDPYINELIPDWGKLAIFGLFSLVMSAMTYHSVHKVHKVHEVKVRDGYDYEEHDYRFDTIKDVALLSFFCMIAAILCGCTGIAGGMVLGPLFLRYNMIPQVMSGTNQYITMVASISVALQFTMLGQLLLPFALLFGAITLVSVYVGIVGVNAYIKKSGKQSVILILLSVVLTMALVSLPLNRLLKGD